MSEPTQNPNAPDATESIVADSGSYELLKKRLADQGLKLQQRTKALNEARLSEFGRAAQALALRTRARTENNCVARDLTRIGDLLLFGYNVFIGLRTETAVSDVFSLYRFREGEENVEELEPVPLTGTFLEDARFVADFRELYTYYKQANITQLRVHQRVGWVSEAQPNIIARAPTKTTPSVPSGQLPRRGSRCKSLPLRGRWL